MRIRIFCSSYTNPGVISPPLLIGVIKISFMTKSMAKHWYISSFKNPPVRKFYILQKGYVRDNTEVR